MVYLVTKRDGRQLFCDGQKIVNAVEKAANATKEKVDAPLIAKEVLQLCSEKHGHSVDVETIQDTVEKVLIKHNYIATAKAYILYREKRGKAREESALITAVQNMFHDYLDDRTWLIKENANSRKSVNGMNNYIREQFTRHYYLNEIYPENIRKAHLEGEFHIHDLGFYGPYCCGWDLQQLVTMGFGGIEGKVTSRPAKHFRSLLGQIVNATFSTQGECAGAQAWSSIDTYCAPFIRYDNLSYKEVKQAIQEFIFNLNVPTRVGFQSPFSNLTFDLQVPSRMKNQHVIIGGEVQNEIYGEFQKEVDLFNLAFCEVMMEGDASQRPFTFPIPTINVTKEFDWDSPVTDAIMEMACKYGTPYFSNYVSSDLDPEDALSMCCRLRLDTTELKKRGGGLFGSNPLTGSIGVVTINLPRIGYLAKDQDDYKQRVAELADLAAISLNLKRKIIEKETERGMYPFSSRWLEPIKKQQGSYWANHFSTIGLVGMEESLRNLFNDQENLTTPKGQKFALEVLDLLNEKIKEYQNKYSTFFNLEATPAEGTSYRLATLDKKAYPDIISSGVDANYYTNSTQLPVAYTQDIFEVLDLQDQLQSSYTGGTVLHLYLGEKIDQIEVAKTLLKKIFSNYSLPYVSLTPTFSTCSDHGYISGEVKKCPTCNKDTEIWTRVVGYLRPVGDFHVGKKEEYDERVEYKVAL
ncbi:MAG: ribonucleoside triphosphate reductase [Sphaerochaetaceae bacterium]